MYASKNATREFALKAVAAAERAMERHVCCKSQFKFKCFSCGEMINRGDNITKCTAPHWDGMRLRFRGADARNGVTMEETAFYLAETGTRTWVHIGCNPCYWDSLPEDSPEYSHPPSAPHIQTGVPRFHMSSMNGANSPITMIWKSFWRNTGILRTSG